VPIVLLLFIFVDFREGGRWLVHSERDTLLDATHKEQPWNFGDAISLRPVSAPWWCSLALVIDGFLPPLASSLRSIDRTG
jgi:hypothetical protein